MPMRKICFIVNPLAGGGRIKAETLIHTSVGRSGVPFEVTLTTHQGHATELARSAAHRAGELVVAVGGDGTVNEVANGLIETDTPLGLIPAGSGNALARSLGVPVDPVEACRCLLDPRLRTIDVGQVAGRYFLSTVGIGLDADVCWLYSRRRGKRGLLPYIATTAIASWAYVREEVTVTLDDGISIQRRPILLTVANTPQYGYGATIAPGALPDDGLLDLCVLETNKIRALWHARRMFTGTISQMPGFSLVRTPTLRIERSGPGRLQLDGEALEADGMLDVRIVPQSLRVVVPNAL